MCLICAQVTELATVKRPQERAYAMQRWHEFGGVMIIGYEMYRNLTQGRSIKSKKLKETFQKSLVDPGNMKTNRKSKYLNDLFTLFTNLNSKMSF